MAEPTELIFACFGLRMGKVLMDGTSKTIGNEGSIGRLKLPKEKGVLHRQEATLNPETSTGHTCLVLLLIVILA